MESISLLNREPNFNGVQRVNSKNDICAINRELEERISKPFVKLQNSDKSISNFIDLNNAIEEVRKEELAKRRVLQKQENSGYILISSLTCIGTLLVTAIIFMTVKYIILG